MVLVVVLVMVGGSLALPQPALEEQTPPPGPPEILPEGEVGEGWGSRWQEEEELEERLEKQLEELEELEELEGELEITAVVSGSPMDLEEANSTEVWREEGGLVVEVRGPVVVGEETTPLLLLSWWQVLLLVLSCLLGCCLCSYLSGCCFLTVDCCSDPYWCCCSCLHPCVSPLKPPPHVSHTLTRRAAHLSTTYSLNESSTAPRRSIERDLLLPSPSKPSVTSGGSSRSLRASTPVTLGVAHLSSSPMLAVEEDSMATLPTSTLQSGKSVRNYKRPAAAGRPGAGLSESQPHVYKEGSASYFSWLHLLGRSSKRYTVTEPGRAKAGAGPVYRQNTRYRHIADNSRNSAVIPTRIAKRASTASNFNGRPYISKRSRCSLALYL